MISTRLIFGNQILFILLCLSLLSDTCLGAGLSFSGQQVQGSLIQGMAVPGARVEVDGESVRVADNGLFLVGFGRVITHRRPASRLHIPMATPNSRRWRWRVASIESSGLTVCRRGK